jgi:outer membrane protein OmpA-like peptidoglycan-associated protein
MNLALLRLLPCLLLAVVQAALLVAALARPSVAEDPLTLKDILSKAQTEAETRAVNELIDKLKGNAPKKPPDAAGQPAAAAPASVPPVALPPSPAPSPPPAASQAAQGSGQGRGQGSGQGGGQGSSSAPLPEAPPATSTAAPVPVGPAPETPAPEAAVAAAEKQQLPSVDLEIFFAYNSDAIEPQAVPALKTLGQALSDARLAGDAFLIAGHTDAKGGKRFNIDLSRRRAEAVRRFLLANFRIDAKRLVARGFGATHLKNRGEPLSAENRRVQVVNLSQDRRP